MPDYHHPRDRMGADRSFRLAIEVLGPGQASTGSALWLLDVIVLMPDGERVAGTQPASPSSQDATRS